MNSLNKRRDTFAPFKLQTVYVHLLHSVVTVKVDDRLNDLQKTLQKILEASLLKRLIFLKWVWNKNKVLQIKVLQNKVVIEKVDKHNNSKHGAIDHVAEKYDCVNLSTLYFFQHRNNDKISTKMK